MIGALLISGDLMVYASFSPASSSESRIEVESIEEGEVRGLISRSRHVVRSVSKSIKQTHHFSSCFNRVLIKTTTGVKASTTPRFIRFCTFLN